MRQAMRAAFWVLRQPPPPSATTAVRCASSAAGAAAFCGVRSSSLGAAQLRWCGHAAREALALRQRAVSGGSAEAGHVTIPSGHLPYVVRDPSGAPIFAGITPSIIATHDALQRAGSVPDGWAFSVATASDFSNVCFELTMRDCIRQHESTGLAVQPPEIAPSVVKRACLYAVVSGKQRSIVVTRDIEQTRLTHHLKDGKYRRLRYVTGTCDEQSLQDALTRTIADSIRAGHTLSLPPFNSHVTLSFEIVDATVTPTFVTARSLEHAVRTCVVKGLLTAHSSFRQVAAEHSFVYEVVDREGQRVFVGTAASMTSALRHRVVRRLADEGCEVRKVRDVEGGRAEVQAAKESVIAESLAAGCTLRNFGVRSSPFLYEVVDEGGCRVFVGVSRNPSHAVTVLRRRGILCEGRRLAKIKDVPVNVSTAEAKAALIAESVASGCPLLNVVASRKLRILYEVVDREGQRVFVGTAASMTSALRHRIVRRLADEGYEVRKVRDVEGGRAEVQAAKESVIAESLAAGCTLWNFGVRSSPFLYEVVDEGGYRVFVGVSCNPSQAVYFLRGRGILCEGRRFAKIKDVPVNVSTAEAKAALIAESVASGCRLLNVVASRKLRILYEVVDREGQRVFVGTAASMTSALRHRIVRRLADEGCEVRKVRDVEGGRAEVQAAKESVIAESLAAGCTLWNFGVRSSPFLYEVVDEGGCRVFVGVSGSLSQTVYFLRRRAILCEGRRFAKIKDVPVNVSTAEAKAALIAESVASGCRLLNVVTSKKLRILYEVVDREGQRVFVGTAVSMTSALRHCVVRRLADEGCEVRKVRDVEGGRAEVQAAKESVIAESLAAGCALWNFGVRSSPFLYEVVDEGGCRVFVGVSRNPRQAVYFLRRRGILCEGRRLAKVKDVPVNVSTAEAKAALIAESVASGSRLLNVVASMKLRVPCVYEVVDREGQRVFVGTAVSMTSALRHCVVRRLADEGCEVRKVRDVEGGRAEVQAAKESVIAESLAAGCTLWNFGVRSSPFLYEVVDEGGCRVFVGVSSNPSRTVYFLRRRGILCEGRRFAKIKDVPVNVSTAEAKAALIAESVASGCRLLNVVASKKLRILYEVVDREGQRVFVGTAVSMTSALRHCVVRRLADEGCEVRKVRDVEGGRAEVQAAKESVIAESLAAGCTLWNFGVRSSPFLYEVVDEGGCRVFVGVSRHLGAAASQLRGRGILCEGRRLAKIKDVPVNVSTAEAKAALIAESVASGCPLLNVVTSKKLRVPCVYEVVDREGQRVFVGTAASMTSALRHRIVRRLADEGCEVRKVRDVEGGRAEVQAAKESVIAESLAAGCALWNFGVRSSPFLYEVVDEGGCRVFVGVSGSLSQTVYFLRRRAILCEGRRFAKIKDVPVNVSTAEAKAALIAESVASGCPLLNVVASRKLRVPCVYEVVDREGQRVFVGTAASMTSALRHCVVRRLADEGCEVRKVRDVEGGRAEVQAAKESVIAESLAAGCTLRNFGVRSSPFLYEVVDEGGCRVFVGVSTNLMLTVSVLRRRGILCEGRRLAKIKDVPVNVSTAEAKAALIAESVASGCPLLNVVPSRKLRVPCVYEVVDREGQRVFVGTAASMTSALRHRIVRRLADEGCEVRKVRDVEGGRAEVQAAKESVIAESLAAGCTLRNFGVRSSPFLYEVVDEGGCRVFVGVSTNLMLTVSVLRRRGILCEGRRLAKIKDVPVNVSTAEAKAALIAESVASGCPLLNVVPSRKLRVPCVYEVVDREGQRVFVGTAASMTSALRHRVVRRLADEGCEVRKVRDVEGGRAEVQAAKESVIAESLAAGCTLWNFGVRSSPFLYEVVDEGGCRVFVGVSGSLSQTVYFLRGRAILCEGRRLAKIKDVPVNVSTAEAKAALIAESVASGCPLLNVVTSRKLRVPCVYEVVDREGQRVFVGTAASMTSALRHRIVRRLADEGCEVRKVRDVEGGRAEVQAAKESVIAESLAAGCTLRNFGVRSSPFLYEVVDEGGCRVFVGVSTNLMLTVSVLRRRGILCEGRRFAKIKDVPVNVSTAEAKAALIAESVASGCPLLNVVASKKLRISCVYEVVDREGQRVFVGTAASMTSALRHRVVRRLADEGCEVRKVRDVEGGRAEVQAAKESVIAESLAAGCTLWNFGVRSSPFLYEVVDEGGCRVFVGVSSNPSRAVTVLRRRGILCEGRRLAKIKDVPVNVSTAEAKAALIAESVASGCPLLNVVTSRKLRILYEVVDREGQRVFVGTAASMTSALRHCVVRRLADEGYEVRKVRDVVGGRAEVQAAKESVIAESLAAGCTLWNFGVRSSPFLYEVVDEGGCRVFVGVSSNPSRTVYFLRRRGILCEGRRLAKIKDVPVNVSTAEAKAALIAESVASGCPLLNVVASRKLRILYEVVDREGQRVFVGTAVSMTSALRHCVVRRLADEGCEVRKVRDVEGGRAEVQAAKESVIAESLAAGCALWNFGVRSSPFLYEVVDEGGCRVFVGVSCNPSHAVYFLRRRGILCEGRRLAKIKDVPVNVSTAEAKAALIAESVASGCRLLNVVASMKLRVPCVYEVVDREGQRVFVGTAVSMTSALRHCVVRRLADEGCEVRKVRDVEGGRAEVQAAKESVIAESLAAGCTLWNFGVRSSPFLYEVVDEGGCRVFVGVSCNPSQAVSVLRRRGILCEGRRFAKIKDVPVNVSTAEAKAALIAESVASGCPLLNVVTSRKLRVPCVYEVVDREGQRVFVGTAASMTSALRHRIVRRLADEGCEVRKVRDVEGGRAEVQAAKESVIAESLAAGCALWNFGVRSSPFLYEVVDEGGCRVFVGVSRNPSQAVYFLRGRGILCEGRRLAKIKDVPVNVSTAEAKAALIAESVASGCPLLNVVASKKLRVPCVYEVVDREGQRVFVGTAASMTSALRHRVVRRLADEGCEVRKVRDVEGGRAEVQAAKESVIAESLAAGCALWNLGVRSSPFLYEVVDEGGCRVFVGVSGSLSQTVSFLRRRGILCDGRRLAKIKDVPVNVSTAEAKAALIAESVASGCRLLNVVTSKKLRVPCVYEVVDREGQRVFVGTAASMTSALQQRIVRRFADSGCKVRKVRDVEGGRAEVQAAKESVIAESLAAGCTLWNFGVRSSPFLYEVVDEGGCRVFVGLSRNPRQAVRFLRRRNMLCDGRQFAKIRNVPVDVALAKSELIVERLSLPDGFWKTSSARFLCSGDRVDPALAASRTFVPPLFTIQLCLRALEASYLRTSYFFDLHASVLNAPRVGGVPLSSDRGVIYALFDDSSRVAYVGQTMYTAVFRLRCHIHAVRVAWKKHMCPTQMSTHHAAMLRNGAPFYVAVVEKVVGPWSCRRTFRDLATEREKHYIKLLKPRFNTTYMSLTRS